ncbi:uncharacterized protein LOC119408976 [Nematolebias whitei]|uniref:uncharacterized protein LOC119408976 n=1 Tax=Nematolebias whitei TaxID=451745 RepID=UPI001897CD54|nr:uncharacterized protein LOC119408976 [Nematolebias whitei]
MVTAEYFFRLSLCALLIQLAHGYPIKGFEHDEQSSSDSDHSASHHGEAGGYYAPMSYSESRHVSSPVQGYSPSQYVYRDAANYMPGAGYPDAAYMPGYPSSSQTEAAQSSPPEIKWSVAPKIFSEEGLANTEAVGSGNFVPAPPPPAPYGPVLQSGETSNVVKEAELGNYQQETEELGYPSGHLGSSFASPFLPIVGLGGYPGLYPYPYSYPAFDLRLLYGLHPPGTYTTLSKNHEKGKDYDQDVHYLREHGPLEISGGYGQEKKIFQLTP